MSSRKGPCPTEEPSLILTWLLLFSARCLFPLRGSDRDRGVPNAHSPGQGSCSSPPTRPQAGCPASSPSAPSAPDQRDQDSHPTREEEKVHHCHWRVSPGNTVSPRFLDPGNSPGSGEAGPQCWWRGRRWAGC